MSLIVSYNTWIGVAIEADGNSPYADSPGTGEAAPLRFLPLSGDESLNTIYNYQDLPMPEGQPYPVKYEQFSSRVEGSLQMTVPPGLLGSSAGVGTFDTTFNLYNWIFNRQTVTGITNQTPTATIWVNVGNRIKKFVGCKVASADFQVAKGQPLTVTLNIMAAREFNISAGSFSFTAPTWWQEAVFGGDTVAVEIPVGTNQINMDAMRFTVNNKLDDDPHRLWTAGFPRRMYNRDRETSGSFERDYLTDTIYNDFLAGNESSVKAVFSKTVGSGLYTATFRFPRVRYGSTQGVNAGGQKDRILKNNVDWKAYGTLSGGSATAEMFWE